MADADTTGNQRALALMTSFKMSTEGGGEIDENAGLAFFDIIEELETAIRNAATDDERKHASKMLYDTVIALVSIANGALDLFAGESDMDPYKMLFGVAATFLLKGTIPT